MRADNIGRDRAEVELEQKEIWRPVPGYPDYWASNYGRVRSYKNGNEPRLLTPRRMACKSGSTSLLVTAGGRNQTVQRMVWTAFNGPLSSNMVVKFKSACREDCRLENLYVVRKSDTTREMVSSHRRSVVVYRHGEEIDVLPDCKAVARKYLVSQNTVRYRCLAARKKPMYDGLDFSYEDDAWGIKRVKSRATN